MKLELPDVPQCYFCEVQHGGDGHWLLWAEDELTMTMLNGRQYERGQSIVFTRRHAPTLLDLDAAELSAVLAAARRAADVLVDTLAPEGLLLYQNNGVGSGQEVPHFHLHVVPRSPGSDWGFGPPALAELERRAGDPRFDHTVDTDEKREMVTRLRKEARQ